MHSRTHQAAHDPLRERTEANWLRAAAGGDVAAFERLYRQLYPRLFRFVLRVLGRLEPVDDVLSETMLAVWRGAAGYPDGARASAWIFGIAYHKALQALRQRGLDPLQQQREPVAPGSVEEAADGAALRQSLRCALALLPADQRAAIDLTFFHGYSCEEVAQILGCPVGTVKSRVFMARARLRPLLARLHQESL